MTYLYGRVFDWHKYESICQQYQIANVHYFPAYRAGEFSAYAKKHSSCEQKGVAVFFTKRDNIKKYR